MSANQVNSGAERTVVRKAWELKKGVLMTRAEARAFLIELGVAEPTEAQVSLYLNTANANRQQQPVQQPAQNNAELERLRGIEQQYQTLLDANNGSDDKIVGI